MSKRERVKREKKRNGWIIAGMIAAVLLVFFFGAGILLPNDRIASGISVDGIDLGNKTEEEAKAVLENASLSVRSISITSGGQTLEIQPEEISLGIDPVMTAKKAFGIGKSKNWISNSVTAYKLLFGGEKLHFVPTADEKQLSGILYAFGTTINGEYTEYQIEKKDQSVRLIPGIPGQNPDTKKAASEILASVENGIYQNIPVTLDKINPPEVSEEEIRQKVNAEAQDASYEYQGNEVSIREHVVGMEITDSELSKKLSEFNRASEVSIEVKTVAPKVTTETLRAKLFNTTLASYATTYSTKAANRASNVALAASRINGTVIPPGETFSYNQTIGDTTLKNGYKVASIYENGKTSEGVGGGICQVSTTLYSAVLYADLKVVERRNHSLTVAYAPKGQDATVSYGAIDFRFQNNMNYPVKVVASTGGGKVTVSIVGTKRDVERTVKITHAVVQTTEPTTKETPDPNLPEGTKKVTSAGRAGYVVDTYKTVIENGQEISSGKITRSTYKMVPTEVAVGTKANEYVAPSPAPTDPPAAETAAEKTQQNHDEAIHQPAV